MLTDGVSRIRKLLIHKKRLFGKEEGRGPRLWLARKGDFYWFYSIPRNKHYRLFEIPCLILSISRIDIFFRKFSYLAYVIGCGHYSTIPHIDMLLQWVE